jgi:alkylation response protein AidB-like acyl-CoA dehydrogenase
MAQAWAAQAAIMLMKERVRRAILDGRTPGPEGALTKLASSSFVRRISSLGLDVGGDVNLAWDQGDDHGDAWSARVLAAPGLAIGGGTDEIVSTIVAERVLGLPREASHETPSAVR